MDSAQINPPATPAHRESEVIELSQFEDADIADARNLVGLSARTRDHQIRANHAASKVTAYIRANCVPIAPNTYTALTVGCALRNLGISDPVKRRQVLAAVPNLEPLGDGPHLVFRLREHQ